MSEYTELERELLDALKDIRQMTDADDEESYRADDREGCLDAVFATADRIIAKSIARAGGEG